LNEVHIEEKVIAVVICWIVSLDSFIPSYHVSGKNPPFNRVVL